MAQLPLNYQTQDLPLTYTGSRWMKHSQVCSFGAGQPTGLAILLHNECLIPENLTQ